MAAEVVQLRPFTIGGSEAAAACGVDPYCSPLMLWCRKTMPDRYAVEETEAMLWGKLLEPVILDVLVRHGYGQSWPEDYIDTERDGLGLVFRDPERDWLVGHPDAFAGRDGVWYVLDVKTTGAWNAHLWEDNGAPTPYLVQLQLYMHLTGAQHGLLACLVGGQRLVMRTVERNEETIGLILKGLNRFHGYVTRNEPPPAQGMDSDAEALRGLYPVGEPEKRVTLDREGMSIYHELRERERQYKKVKQQFDQLKQSLQMTMGDAEVAVSPADVPVAKWTTFLRQGQPARRFTVL